MIKLDPYISVATNVDAELWNIRVVLKLCINLNLLAAEIEIDAYVVLGWVSDTCCNNLHHACSYLGLQEPVQTNNIAFVRGEPMCIYASARNE